MALPVTTAKADRRQSTPNEPEHTDKFNAVILIEHNISCMHYDITSFNNLPRHDELSIFHHNSRSLNQNFNDITTFLSLLRDDFSIIGFSETWLNDSISPLISINNFTLIEQHRSDRRGGGVCLFVHNTLSFKHRPDLSIFNPTIESIFVEITTPSSKEKCIIGVIYRPPNGSIDDFNVHLQCILNVITQTKFKSYIMGDYNIDLTNKHKSASFLNTIYAYGFTPTISKPTRISSTSATLIDNIITNVTSTITSGILITDLSDHLPIFIKVPARKYIPKSPIHARNCTTNNIRRFVSSIKENNWDDVLDKHDVNVAYDIFYNIVDSTYNDCFPYRKITKRGKKKHPWITKGILTSIQRKNKLFKRYIKNSTESNKTSYNTYRNKLNHVIRFSKRLYFNNKFYDARNNSKNTWNIINEILHNDRKKSTYPASFKNGDQEITNDIDIANDFNNFFINLGPSLADKITSKGTHNEFMHKTSHNNSIFTFPVCEEELLNVATACLKPNKAAGYDDFKPGIIKHIIPLITKPLTHICNLSFNTGTFPDSLKIAKVIPIFKKGDADLYENYRPISLLSCFSKIIERLMFNRIFNFLNKYDILCNQQYGFRPHHSTELALADAVDKLYSSLDNNRSCLGVFLDLSKAFDTIDHTILLSKLQHYGIRGTTLNWIDSYISNRHQYISYKNTHSHLAEIQCGVPQGSILGPLLFIIYVNDICHVSEIANITLFADDTNIFFESNENENLFHIKVSSELNKFNDWFASNKLSLNIGKTNYIVFNTSRNFSWDKDIFMGGKILKEVFSNKFLGVHIDHKLSWGDHISIVCRKVAKNIGILSKLKHYLPQHILKTLYQTLVVPHFSYCSIIWSGTRDTNLKPLIILQKKAVRHISHAAPRDHTNLLFKDLNVLKINDIIRVNLATFTYKAWNGLLPNAFHNYLISNSDIHHHNTRHANHAHYHNTNTSTGMLSLRNRAIKTWNSITDIIKNKLSCRTFRKCYIKEIIASY